MPRFNWGIPTEIQSYPFTKEPDFGKRKIVRGTLKFGERAEHFVPFILDGAQGKLYLDLNRNQDLTDDSGGVYSCPISNGANYMQTFEGVRLTFKTAMGVHPAMVDLYFMNTGNSGPPPSVSAGSCCLWEGKISLAGQEWQVGLTENLQGRIGFAEGGNLLLHHWSRRNQIASQPGGSPDALFLARHQIYFFGGHAFEMDCSYVQQDTHPKYRLDLKPQPVELGELRLAGKFINRLALTRDGGKPLTVVLDAPDPVVKIPVGTYSQCRVYLKQGQTEAYRASDRYGATPSIRSVLVDAKGQSILDLGGAANQHGYGQPSRQVPGPQLSIGWRRG